MSRRNQISIWSRRSEEDELVESPSGPPLTQKVRADLGKLVSPRERLGTASISMTRVKSSNLRAGHFNRTVDGLELAILSGSLLFEFTEIGDLVREGRFLKLMFSGGILSIEIESEIFR